MKVNRLLSLLLASILSLSLCACGSSGETSSSGSASSMPDEPSVSTMTPVTPDPDPEPVPESEPEPAFPYTNPLTGEGCETDIGKNRPVAVMINNLEKALPQAGVSQADVIYELVAEGGITRMMALFQSVEGVGEIGTVRSARDYYVSLALGHDAVFLHAGGSPKAYEVIKSWGVTALDCVNGPYEGSLFWRDKTRRTNAGLEHSVMTSGETILELFPTYTKLRRQHKDGYLVGWTFTEDAPAASAAQATVLTVPFSKYKTGVFTYNAETGLYMIEEYGKPYVDANTDQQVGVKNVLVLYTDVSSIKGDDKGRQTIRTTGSGEGLLLRDGTVEVITWKRDSDWHTLEFYLSDGTRAPLSVGTSYINILDESRQATWE